tara:strand:+ start:476 stop:715 length:240 start_codon:yes stop_codon:yes gene_type:complete
MNPITFINQMNVKTYAVTEGFEDGKHFYDIAYCLSVKSENPRTFPHLMQKHIRFSQIEPYLQFVDLLHEAGYAFTDEYQ